MKLRLPKVGRSAIALLAAVTALQAQPARAACRADSGTERATLVELYTSEGCSSCPPADVRLGQLTHAGSRIVPLAMHVDYWDSIGWKDAFAQPAFARRQDWEVRANGHRTSYTPHFFANGLEVLDWRSDLDATMRPSKAPALARITIATEVESGGRLRLTVDGRSAPSGKSSGPLQLFVVVTESGLSTQVAAGENHGVRLAHEAVARHWIGPIAVQDGEARLERVVAMPQSAGGRVGVVAFIQDATSAEVLQAVGTGTCVAS